MKRKHQVDFQPTVSKRQHRRRKYGKGPAQRRREKARRK